MKQNHKRKFGCTKLMYSMYSKQMAGRTCSFFLILAAVTLHLSRVQAFVSDWRNLECNLHNIIKTVNETAAETLSLCHVALSCHHLFSKVALSPASCYWEQLRFVRSSHLGSLLGLHEEGSGEFWYRSRSGTIYCNNPPLFSFHYLPPLLLFTRERCVLLSGAGLFKSMCKWRRSGCSSAENELPPVVFGLT